MPQRKQYKVLLIGDSCEDEYIYGRCERLSPEAPVPVMKFSRTEMKSGMAGNVCLNLQAFDTHITFLTNPEKIVKTRMIDEKSNQQLLRVDVEDDLKPLLLPVSTDTFDAVVISDYNKGFLSTDDIEYICNSHNNVLIDTKKILGDYCANAKFIKINEIELQNNISAYVNIDDFKNSLIVTLGGKGCKYKETIYPVSKVVVKDLSGAGDTFMAALAVNYIKTKNIDKLIRFANECATKVVQLKGVNTIK